MSRRNEIAAQIMSELRIINRAVLSGEDAYTENEWEEIKHQIVTLAKSAVENEQQQKARDRAERKEHRRSRKSTTENTETTEAK